jgi:hypothetical protein
LAVEDYLILYKSLDYLACNGLQTPTPHGRKKDLSQVQSSASDEFFSGCCDKLPGCAVCTWFGLIQWWQFLWWRRRTLTLREFLAPLRVHSPKLGWLSCMVADFLQLGSLHKLYCGGPLLLGKVYGIFGLLSCGEPSSNGSEDYLNNT